MELQRPLCFFLVLFTLFSISQARKFNIGGSAGWVPNPSENYNEWSSRNRFLINDTLVFKYKKGSDSVLEVKKEDYDKCNKSNPIKKFEDGETEFKLERTGPFYFISGKEGNCEKGQKLLLVVLAIRGGGAQTQTPSPSASPPSANTPAKSPTPVITPPASGPPAPSPSGSPGPGGGPPSPSPGNNPATSPTPVITPPAGSPVPATGPPAPSPAGSPGPPSPSPSPAKSPGPPGSGFGPTTSPPPGSPLGSAQTPESSNEAAPPPKANGGASGALPSFLVYAVTVVVSAALFR